MNKLALAGTALAAILCSTDSAQAQRRIFGVDVRNDQTFRSTTADFVGNFVPGPANAIDMFALDFDASASRMYAIDDANRDIYRIYRDAMIPVPTGVQVSGIVGMSPSYDFISGLSAHPTNGFWYMSRMISNGTQIYRGDIETGQFTLVTFVAGLYFLDITIDRTGAMYGLEGNTGVLRQIDLVAGTSTAFAFLNSTIQFAQGMDVDWSTNILYAALYFGNGAGEIVSVDLATNVVTVLQDTAVLNGEYEIAIEAGSNAPFGEPYCAGNTNSAGLVGEARGVGSAVLADGIFSLQARDLPNYSWGFFIVSRDDGFVANPGGSEGNLCLTGAIGRYVGPGQIQNTGDDGSFLIPAPLNAIPQPNGFEAVMPGETWHFQAWHRDLVNGTPTSNFSRGVRVRFF